MYIMPLRIPSDEICRDDACDIVGIHTHRLPGDGKGYRAPITKHKVINPESEWTDCYCGTGYIKGEKCGNCDGAGQLPPNRLWAHANEKL